jgi:hypothetical protein
VQAAHELEHAARRRHAAPHLERYVEAHGPDDQGLDVVVDALRCARTSVAPAALTFAAAAVTPLDAAPLANTTAASAATGAPPSIREGGAPPAVVG